MDIPPPTATGRYLAEVGEHLDIAFDTSNGQAAAHGTRDLGGQIPSEATRLTLRFRPVPGWAPPEPWCRQIDIDLRERRLAS